MISITREISAIIRAEDYPKLREREIQEINRWLKDNFGAKFHCQSQKEAIILIKNISAWTRRYRDDLQTYIDSGVWKDQQMDMSAFQRKILAKELGRNSLRKKEHRIKKMLIEMLDLFCFSKKSSDESAFEINKLRNFISSSRLEGIILKEDT